MNGAALISVSLTEQLASGDSVCVTASVIKAGPLRYDTIEFNVDSKAEYSA